MFSSVVMVNPVFEPPYRFVEKVEMTIYDRWGLVMFKTEDPDINGMESKQTGLMVRMERTSTLVQFTKYLKNRSKAAKRVRTLVGKQGTTIQERLQE